MHWLDRLSPRVQAHLERYARRWWFKSLVEARRRPGQDLEAVSDGLALRAELEEKYEIYFRKHARASMDGRTSQHVSTAALCLATYHCLSPHVPKERLLDIIREQSGGSGCAIRFLVRATSFMQTYGSLQQRLKLLQLDRGQGFEAQLSLDNHMSTLRFTRCLYEDIFSKEEKKDLLPAVCCSADSFWFTDQRKFKAGLRDPSKATGGSECLFYVINRGR